MSPQGFNMSSPWRTGILSFAMFAVQRNQDRWETARQIPHVTKHVIILSRWATSVHCYTQPFRSRAITSSSELYCFTFPWPLFTSIRSLYAAPSNLLQQAWVKSSPSTQKNYPSNYVQAEKKKKHLLFDLFFYRIHPFCLRVLEFVSGTSKVTQDIVATVMQQDIFNL